MEKLDLLDKKILYELDLDARIPASKLAKKLKKSKETVNFRINRLINSNYLKGFYTVLNTSKLGWQYYKLYIKFNNITPEKEKQIIQYLQKQNHIAYLASVEGTYNLMVLIMVKTSEDFIKIYHPFMKHFGNSIQEKDIVLFLTTHRLNQKFFYNSKNTKDLSYPIQIQNYKLDKIEEGILSILSSNARLSYSEIAQKLKLDAKVVKYRMNKLEKENIILGYTTSPNFDKLGLQFTQINISLKDPTIAKKIIKYFDSTNKCLFAMELLGKYDVLAELHVNDNEELNKIMNKFRELFHEYYANYDISTINKEYVMVWAPFSNNSKLNKSK